MEDLIVAVELPLVVGVSTRAMFDLNEEHLIFEKLGVGAYANLQLEREKDVLKPGAAFEVVRRLLALNDQHEDPIVEVVLLSRNSPDSSLRACNSFEHYNLSIRHGSFTIGRSVAPLAKAWNIDLFASNDDQDVHSVALAGTAAAKLGPAPVTADDIPSDEVRFAFDGEAVLFSDESDVVYQKHGLVGFHEHERKNVTVPMNCGPFGKTFLPKLALLRQRFMKPDGKSCIRIAIVTARNAPAHERVIQTLRLWGIPADEAHFVGQHQKGPIVHAIRTHILFDDQERHVLSASGLVSVGLVPGPHLPDQPIIPG